MQYNDRSPLENMWGFAQRAFRVFSMVVSQWWFSSAFWEVQWFPGGSREFCFPDGIRLKQDDCHSGLCVFVSRSVGCGQCGSSIRPAHDVDV